MKTYLIKRSYETECFLKVGVTNAKKESQRHDFGKTPTKDADLPFREKAMTLLNGKKYIPDSRYDWQSIHSEEFEYEGQARYLEKLVLDKFQTISYIPKQKISGYSECLAYSEDNKNRIRDYTVQTSKKIKAETPDKLRYVWIGMKVRKDDPIEKHLEIVKRWRAQQG
jgi:hypothetical protein